jgi:hypothetical protein
MKIRFSTQVAVLVEHMTAAVGGQEWSGLGFVEREGDEIRVYDVVPLNIGDTVYTEIPAEELLKLMQRDDYENMRLWIHRHPVGNGIPGFHNWSGTDEATIQQAPLGSPPELVKWSVSVVRTPLGWVGRVDNHITKKTIHCEVYPRVSEFVITKRWQTLPVWRRPTIERPVESYQAKSFWGTLRDRFVAKPKKIKGAQASFAWEDDINTYTRRGWDGREYDYMECYACGLDVQTDDMLQCTFCGQFFCEDCAIQDQDIEDYDLDLEGDYVCYDCLRSLRGK